MKSNTIHFGIVAISICLLFSTTNLFADSNAWDEMKKLVASDAEANDWFGLSVAAAGDVAVVGAYQEDTGGGSAGAAYIFKWSAGGANAWGEVKKLTASDAQPWDYFGYSVAVAGDVAVVGAYGEAAAAGNNSGAAYIFERNMGGTNAWGEVKKLTASDAEGYDSFGYSVAVAGDVVVVGAIYKDIGSCNSAGAAYVFERNAGGANAWGEVKKLTASDAEEEDRFGISVAAAGDVVVVGARFEDTGGDNAGAAYVFEQNVGGTNAWGEVKKLTASDAEVGDGFGVSVAMADNVAVVGAAYEYAGGPAAGAAYVFERNASGTNAWGEVKKLTASDAEELDRFGISVAVAGDVAVVGAFGESTNGINSGAAYVFERNAGGTNAWGEVKKLTASDAEGYDNFGYSVAVAGNVAVVGAYGEDTGGAAAGAAYVFGMYVPPPKDMFDDAEPLPDTNGDSRGSNTNATIEPGEPAHAGYGPFHSVWWNWTAPTNALMLETTATLYLQVDTYGSDFDTVLAIYTGSNISSLTEITSNNDAEPGTNTSRVAFALVPDEIYRIAVDGKTINDTGNIILHYGIVPEPGTEWITGILYLWIVVKRRKRVPAVPACPAYAGG